MAADPDDDALRWEGDDDPTLAPGWKVVGGPAAIPATPSTSASATASATGDADASGDASAVRVAHTPEDPDAPHQTGSVELVVLGVLGGAYLLYAVGWLIAALGPGTGLTDPVAVFMDVLGRWFAVFAAPLWFGVVLWLTSGRSRMRLVWLVVGAVLLVPLPFLLRG